MYTIYLPQIFIFPNCFVFCALIDFSLNRENNVCDINPVHHLFAAGTLEVGVVVVYTALLCFFVPGSDFTECACCVAVYRGKWNAGTHVCAVVWASWTALSAV